jgi:hypothetical protein
MCGSRRFFKVVRHDILDGLMTVRTCVSGWGSGVLAAWVGLEYGDLQVGPSGVGGQFDVVEQYSQDLVLDGDDDCLAGVGASDA